MSSRRAKLTGSTRSRNSRSSEKEPQNNRLYFCLRLELNQNKNFLDHLKFSNKDLYSDVKDLYNQDKFKICINFIDYKKISKIKGERTEGCIKFAQSVNMIGQVCKVLANLEHLPCTFGYFISRNKTLQLRTQFRHTVLDTDLGGNEVTFQNLNHELNREIQIMIFHVDDIPKHRTDTASFY